MKLHSCCGLRVSGLSFGSTTFGGVQVGFQGLEPDRSRRNLLIDICFEAGVNLFDTANG
jgi:aryl-alcohol dehydrogenase-like predicted oxidoreductase